MNFTPKQFTQWASKAGFVLCHDEYEFKEMLRLFAVNAGKATQTEVDANIAKQQIITNAAGDSQNGNNRACAIIEYNIRAALAYAERSELDLDCDLCGNGPLVYTVECKACKGIYAGSAELNATVASHRKHHCTPTNTP